MSSVNATTFAEEWDTAEEAIAENGEPIILRQPVSIETATGPDAGQVERSPLSTSALKANGAFLTGVSSVDLDAAAVTGLLVAGDTIEFAGHSTVYTVTAGPYAATGNAISGVALSAPLAADVADDEAVTVTFSGTDTALVGLFLESKLRMVSGVLTRYGDHRIFVSQKAIDAAGVVVERGNQLFRGSDASTGKPMGILDLEPIVSEAAVYLVAEEH